MSVAAAAGLFAGSRCFALGALPYADPAGRSPRPPPLCAQLPARPRGIEGPRSRVGVSRMQRGVGRASTPVAQRNYPPRYSVSE
jgi:hypothetical protein